MQCRQLDDMSQYASHGSGRVAREMPINPVHGFIRAPTRLSRLLSGATNG
jgi:hypothetical protein